MASKNVRPKSLIAQTQLNLRNVQAAHREQFLRNEGLSAGSSASSSFVSGLRQKPPQLPGGYPPKSLDAEASDRNASTASSFHSEASPRSSSRHGRSSSSKLPAVEVSLPRLPSPRRSPDGSSRSKAGSYSLASDTARSSASGSPVHRASEHADEDDMDDDDFAQQLQELDDLCNILDGYQPSSSSSARVHSDQRPETGGTTTSASTTLPGSSLATCEAGDLDESGVDEFVASEDPWDSLCGAQRAHYEISRLRLPHGCRLETSPGSYAQFFLHMDIAEGPYTPASLVFWVKIFAEFPAAGSVSIRCTKRLFHPSIDPITGRVEVTGTAEDMQSEPMSLSTLISGILQLVKKPTDTPSINSDAAILLQTDPDEFRRTVRLTLNGGDYAGYHYDKILAAGKAPVQKATLTEDSHFNTSLSENNRLSLMQLEALRDQFKAESSIFQDKNLKELRVLEH